MYMAKTCGTVASPTSTVLATRKDSVKGTASWRTEEQNQNVCLCPICDDPIIRIELYTTSIGQDSIYCDGWVRGVVSQGMHGVV